MTTTRKVRRRAIGAECVDGGVHFRLWAPDHESVGIALRGSGVTIDHNADGYPGIQMEREESGYHSVYVEGAGAGTRYSFRPKGSEGSFPDPASRSQPDGPHGPSQVIDPSAYRWRNPSPDLALDRQVLYEMHIGTFTRGGTWAMAIEELPSLADLGVTTLEVMPISEFPGRFGWGYDGVDLWAPTHLYGTPDDFRHFVDEAHGLGLAVILDVVYNHFGPDGCFLKSFAGSYFTDRYENDWGEAINFEGPDAGPVREFFVENAAHWIDEYRLDGLRLDATQSILDASERHVLSEVSRAAREAAGGRSVFLVAENEPQERRVLQPGDEGGFGVDAMWNDDFHHTAVVALTGRREAYYTDYTARPQEFISAAKHGFLYQGQHYSWQKNRRGTIVRGIEPWRFVWFLENHDQVANSAFSQRLHQVSSPGRMRALTALVLLGPATPMLFQGQEWGATQPFTYFADHEPELARKVSEGRRRFMEQFPSCTTDEARALFRDPAAFETFEVSRLDRSEVDEAILALHLDLIRLRREKDVLRRELDGAVLSEQAFVLRWFGGAASDDLLLIVNLGAQFRLQPAPEPLLAPHAGMRWAVAWSSESPRYGGSGTAEPETDEGWTIPGECAVLLACEPD